MNTDYEEFESKLGYTFKDKSLLRLSLTHTTYVFEQKKDHYESNQRLEYIGDAVIDLVIGRKLYELKPEAAEGYLSKIRSIIVCEESFAKLAKLIGVDELPKTAIFIDPKDRSTPETEAELEKFCELLK